MRKQAFALGIGIAAVVGFVLLHGEAGASAQGATLTGRVRFTGTPPSNPRIDMSEEPKCRAKYTTPPTEERAVVGQGGALANVFVYVKTGLTPAPRPAPTAPAVIDQDGCRYHPHVFGVRVGQTLQIKNSDGILHNIKALSRANRGFNISQPTAMTTDRARAFAAPEVMVTIECNVHGWMKAYVGVLDHPYFAVSGTDGTFRIPNLPPGTYTIEAWHERFGTQTATVTVPATGSKTQDFTFTAAAGR